MRFSILLSAASLVAALAATGTAASAGTIVNLCTGGSGGPYHNAGLMIAEQSKGDPSLEIRVIADTGGTWGNIGMSTDRDGRAGPEKFEAGAACHAFIGQPDGPVLLSREAPAESKKITSIAKLHYEYLHALCGKSSGVDDIGDLESMDNASVALGSQGSGAWLIWQNFVNEDEDYGKVATSTLSGIDAIAAVASGDVTCALVPAGLGNSIVNEADELYGSDLVLVGVNDRDFNDAVDIRGEPLYEWAEIPSGTYAKNLQGWFSSKDTIRWRANVYVNTSRLTDAKAKSALIRAVARAKSGIVQTYGGE